MLIEPVLLSSWLIRYRDNVKREPITTDAPDAPSIFMAAEDHDVFGVGDVGDERWLEQVLNEHRSPDFFKQQ